MNNSGVKFSSWERENIALAAVAQCAAIVDRLATKGQSDQRELAASVNPLLVLNPPTFSDVYPNVTDLSLGFRTLQSMFSNTRPNTESAVLRYTLGLLHIRGSLERNSGMQAQIRESLAGVDSLVGAEDSAVDLAGELENKIAVEHDQLVIKQLAALYQDTISTLNYRIQIQGKAELLKNDQVANTIRAVLLSGIRSAVLWHQLGGRRWRLLIYRRRIYDTSTEIRKKLLRPV